MYDVFGLKEICTSNRDIIFNLNMLNRQKVIQFLITKTNEGYRIVIPPFILKMTVISDFVKVYKILLNI